MGCVLLKLAVSSSRLGFNDSNYNYGSAFLINAINQIPREQFPFTTTIIEENGRFIFT